VVTQRPSDVDNSVLSQCGTMLALRVSNPNDRSAVSSSIPDDLGGLTELLPSLRTGEVLVLGMRYKSHHGFEFRRRDASRSAKIRSFPMPGAKVPVRTFATTAKQCVIGGLNQQREYERKEENCHDRTRDALG